MLARAYAFHGMEVAPEIIEGVRRYVEDRSEPGSFLSAVIENDLAGAVRFADDYNMRTLPAVVAYLYNEAPSACWGSPAKMLAWLSEPPEWRTGS